MNRDLFGDESHYYAAPDVPERKSDEQWDSSLEQRVRPLLKSQHADVRKRVEQTCKQHNMAIREYLRSETALKLSQADRRQIVPYQVVDGIPQSLARLLDELPNPILLHLLQKRHLLQNGKLALDFVLNAFLDISEILDNPHSEKQESLKSSQQYLQIILAKIDEFKLPHDIKKIDEDILGAYFFKVPLIEIYWMPIGLVAGILDVSVEGLSFVVLAHELAHAYTHLGLDIDSGQWVTTEFARTSKMIIEGLAQFYTKSICNKYANRQPEILIAFEKLLELQPTAYTAFENWPKQHASEVVRFSMIFARSNNIKDYNSFLNEMDVIKQKIPVRNIHMNLS